MKLSKNEFKALISLLDDNDEEIAQHVKEKLLALGKEIIPTLEDEWGHSFDSLKQQRIEYIIHQIQFDSLLVELKEWKVNNHHDVIAGSILIARHQYPDLDEDKLRDELNQIRRDIWIELNDGLTAYEKVHVFNRVFYDNFQFRGNTTNFNAPGNSYLNVVLETHKGNPLLLSIIYSHIAQQLNMPVYGVNLPDHFILAYLDENNVLAEIDADSNAQVLFYINAFSKGTIFGKEEIDQFLKKLNLTPEKQFYEPCNNIDIIKRMLRNLIFSYQKLGDVEKVNELSRMMESLES